ncbi:hypothetical protein P7C71_g6557, partial [Lecanoromycetidae sp. Uapishka_2]
MPDFSAQLQRVDSLHQQLKMEAARAQDFLAKLKRGEEIQSQNHVQAKLPSLTEDDTPRSPVHKGIERGEKDVRNRKHSEKEVKNGKNSGKDSVCCCQHHQSKPLTEKEKKTAEDYRKARLGPLGSLPPLPTHVDEREVRDLEKRVRGLEGRVRGFEGLPPDREMALLEVERLRRELEGLARRREGLFGLIDEKTKGVGKVNRKEVGKAGGTDNGSINGKTNGKG